jgi:putative addiction module killer protein
VVQILTYEDPAGRLPFDRWLGRLRDEAARSAVLVRLRRLSLGLPGDSRSVGSGLFELRLHIGPGYRVYFAWDGPDRVLLLGGGTKAMQAADIAVAREQLERH